jgi:hypothetical protein
MSLVLAAGPVRADGIPFLGGTLGGTVTYQGGNVLLKFLYQQASFNNELFAFRMPTGQTFDPKNAVAIFNNHNDPAGTTFSFDPHAVLGLNPGDELIFGICSNVSSNGTLDCGGGRRGESLIYSGDGSRNPDGVAHARFEASCSNAGICGSFTGNVMGFEDLREHVSDHDYNDVVFSIQQTPQSSVPEPTSMALMASGLMGMGGTGWLRRRRLSRE